MEDVRYIEFQFLQALANRSIQYFNSQDANQRKIYGKLPASYSDMLVTLVEDGYVKFHQQDLQFLAARLRNEIPVSSNVRARFNQHQWENPRDGIEHMLVSSTLQEIQITFRGLRRTEELRDLLKNERILDDFGVLTSMRYFRRDFEDALHRGADTPVSILYADMDNFGGINKNYGQAAGDVVMKSYLEVVRDKLGLLGEGYRGVGDEVAAIIVGQGHQRAVELGELIRQGVESMVCKHKDVVLPKVSASIGVATTPPNERGLELETLAESRKRIAKQTGKNRVVSFE